MGERGSPQQPVHIAIVMDGNGRWAEARGLPRIAGHQQGVETVKAVVRACIERGIPVLTLFAWSCENWQRPLQEVNFLMDLFVSTLQSHLDELIEQGVALRFSGDRNALSAPLRSLMTRAEERSQHNTRLTLNLALNYSGRWDVVQACARILAERPNMSPDAMTEELLSQYLSTAGLPDPDLFIRTSGEQRISNFILFQLAYTELYFTEVCWPDFTPAILDEALASYVMRERRFGMVPQRGCMPEELSDA